MLRYTLFFYVEIRVIVGGFLLRRSSVKILILVVQLPGEGGIAIK